MARRYITGEADLEATLKKLSDRTADKVARSALRAGLTVIARAMRKAAPRGPTGNLRKAIGSRLVRSRKTGVVTAKAGINVGKNRKGRAPHGHLVALGTKPRTRKRIGGKFAFITSPAPEQLRTGTMPANDFARRSSTSAQASMRMAMKNKAAKVLEKEAAKASKGTK